MLHYLVFTTLLVGQGLSDTTYAKVRDEVLPSQEELKYRQIGWRPTLWEALVDAQKQDKPILLYAMNGNPLGRV